VAGRSLLRGWRREKNTPNQEDEKSECDGEKGSFFHGFSAAGRSRRGREGGNGIPVQDSRVRLASDRTVPAPRPRIRSRWERTDRLAEAGERRISCSLSTAPPGTRGAGERSLRPVHGPSSHRPPDGGEKIPLHLRVGHPGRFRLDVHDDVPSRI